MNLINKIKNLGSDTTHSSSNTQDWYVTAERAEGINDEDMFSKNDAYLKFDFGGKQVRTRSIKNDRSPNWNETFHFKLSPDHAKDIHLKVMDDDFGLDDGIGHAKISRAELPMNPGEEKLLKVPIFHKDLVRGMVYLRVKFLLENQPMQQTTGMQNQQTQPMTQQPYMQTQQQPYVQSQQQPYTQSQQQPYTQSQQQPYTQSQQQPYTQSQQHYGQPQQQQGSMNQPPSNYGQRY